MCSRVCPREKRERGGGGAVACMSWKRSEMSCTALADSPTAFCASSPAKRRLLSAAMGSRVLEMWSSTLSLCAGRELVRTVHESFDEGEAESTEIKADELTGCSEDQNFVARALPSVARHTERVWGEGTEVGGDRIREGGQGMGEVGHGDAPLGARASAAGRMPVAGAPAPGEPWGGASSRTPGGTPGRMPRPAPEEPRWSAGGDSWWTRGRGSLGGPCAGTRG